MTLQVTGKISIQGIDCEKCGEAIQQWAFSEVMKCGTCGAVYELDSSSLEDQYVLYEYSFSHFQCMHSSLRGACQNPCPAPGMYCQQHVSDECFEEAKKSISYCENRLEQSKDKLERMKESKKTWLIQKMSGIDDEQDDALQEDETG